MAFLVDALEKWSCLLNVFVTIVTKVDYCACEFLTSQTDDSHVVRMDAGSTTAGRGAAVQAEHNVQMKPGSNIDLKLHPALCLLLGWVIPVSKYPLSFQPSHQAD